MSDPEETVVEVPYKEQMLAYEETTRKNIRAVIDHSNETRLLVNSLKEEIQSLKNLVSSKDTQIANMNQRIAGLQQKLINFK